MTGNLGELPVHLKLQINNLVDLSTVAAIQNGNRSWVKIHSALWVNIQSALTPRNAWGLQPLYAGLINTPVPLPSYDHNAARIQTKVASLLVTVHGEFHPVWAYVLSVLASSARILPVADRFARALF